MERKCTRWLLAGLATEAAAQDGETARPERKLFLTRTDEVEPLPPSPRSLLSFLQVGGEKAMVLILSTDITTF